MIFVTKIDPDDPDWAGIVDAGDRLKAAHLASFDKGEGFEINDVLYKRYMRYLLTIFGGKCAYCETELTSNQPGDVEHFRPKGRVVDDRFKPVRINHPAKGAIDHPGYFWLAYSWGNLLPSCIDCNRYRKHGSVNPVGVGKADRFPVEGVHAGTPEDVIKEIVLLIDPTKLDPCEHLDFSEDGYVVAKSPIGQQTIDLFGLNDREGLVEQRAKAFEDGTAFMEGHWNAVTTNNAARVEKNRKRLEQIRAGRIPYAIMHRLAVRKVNARLRAEQDLLVGADE